MTEITAADLGERPCMVVAHPDDETLWAGGLLARFRDLRWTAVCCSTPRRDPRRAMDWLAATAAFDVIARCQLEITEGEPGRPIPDLGLPLRSAIRTAEPDCIVTHGMLGEYGHNQHIQVHHAVLDAFPGRVLGFGWSPHDRGKLTLTLTPEEYELKRMALDCYGDKAKALRQRYYTELGVPEKVETYDIYRA